MGGVTNFVSDVVGGVGDAVGDVVGGVADVAEDVVGGAVDIVEDVAGGVGDVVEDVGDFAGDVFEDVSDVVEDAWDNDIVRTAALAAGAYFGAPYVLGSAGTAATHPLYGTYAYSGGSGVLGAAASAFPETYATLSSFGSTALGAAKTVGFEVAKNVGTQMVTGALTGGGAGGGGGGQGFVPQRLSRGASTQYGNFAAKAANLGINADVADGMMKVANSNLAELQQFRRDVNRTATLGPTIGLGSTQLGGIGVRSTTRGVS